MSYYRTQRHFDLEPLEPRILLSGDPLLGTLQAIAPDLSADTTEDLRLLAAVEEVRLDTGDDTTSAEASPTNVDLSVLAFYDTSDPQDLNPKAGISTLNQGVLIVLESEDSALPEPSNTAASRANLILSMADLERHDLTLSLQDEGEVYLTVLDTMTEEVLLRLNAKDVESIRFIGQKDVDDMLRLDFSAADLDGGLNIDYSGGSGGYDCLDFSGHSGLDVGYTAIGADGGEIDLASERWQGLVTFSGLEPVFIDGGGSDYTFATMANLVDDIRIEKLDGSTNRIYGTSGGTAFETVKFKNVGKFTLETGSYNDTVLIEEEIVGADDYEIDLGSGDDTLVIEQASGNSLLDLQAGTGQDELIVSVPNGVYRFNAVENLSGTGAVLDPVTVTMTDHGLATGDSVTISGVQGKTNCNGTFTVTRLSANTFTLNSVDDPNAYVSGTGTVSGTTLTDRVAVSGWRAFYNDVENALVKKTAGGAEGLAGGIDSELEATLDSLSDFYTLMESHQEFGADLPILGMSMSELLDPGALLGQVYNDYHTGGSAGTAAVVQNFFSNWSEELTAIDPSVNASTDQVTVSVFEQADTGTVLTDMLSIDWTVEGARTGVSGTFTGTSLLSQAGVTFSDDPSWSFNADFSADLSLMIDAGGSQATEIEFNDITTNITTSAFGLAGETVNIGILGGTLQAGGSLAMSKTARFVNARLSRAELDTVDTLDELNDRVSFIGTAAATIPFTVNAPDGFTITGSSSGEIQIGETNATLFGSDASSTLPVDLPEWAGNFTAYTARDLLAPLKDFANWLDDIQASEYYEASVLFAENAEFSELFNYGDIFRTGVVDALTETDGSSPNYSTLQEMVEKSDDVAIMFDSNTGEVSITAQVENAASTVTESATLNLTQTVGSIENITGTGESGDPITVTLTGHGLATGDTVTVSGVAGKVGSNGTFDVTVVNANSFMLDDASCDLDYVGSGTVTLVENGALVQISGGQVSMTPDMDITFVYGLDGALSDESLSLEGFSSTLMPQDGILDSNAVFTVSVDGSPHSVTVSSGSTIDNASVTDLLEDINTSLPSGVNTSLDTLNGVYILRFTTSGSQRLSITSPNQTAIDILGLNTASASLQAAASIGTIKVEGDSAVMVVQAGTETQTITISSSDTGDNSSFEAVRDDLNAKLAAFTNTVTAELSGTLLTLKSETGPLQINSANTQVQDLLGFEAGQVARDLLAGNAVSTTCAYASLSDLTFYLETQDSGGPKQITVSASAMSGNSSLTDLKNDLQSAVNSAISGVTVTENGNCLTFTHTGTLLRFTADASTVAGQAVLDVLGFQSGDTENASAEKSLWVDADATSVEGHFSASFSDDPDSGIYNAVEVDFDASTSLAEDVILTHGLDATGQLSVDLLKSTGFSSTTSGDADDSGNQVYLHLHGAAMLSGGSSSNVTLNFTVSDISDITTTQLTPTVDDIVENMTLSGVVDAIEGVYDNYFLQASSGDILSGELPFVNMDASDVNTFASEYREAVSKTESWMQTQTLPTLQGLEQTLESELGQRLDAMSVVLAFVPAGDGLTVQITGTLAQSVTQRFSVDLSALEALSGQNLENIPDENGLLTAVSPVEEFEVSSTADFTVGLSIAFDAQGAAQADLLSPSTVTLDVAAEKTDFAFDGIMGMAQFSGITGSVVLDADGISGGAAAQYAYALNENKDIDSISASDLSISLGGAATLTLDSNDWSETLSVNGSNLQNFVQAQSGSVQFTIPTPDLDVSVDNAVFDLLRDPSNLVSGISQVFGDIIVTIHDGFHALEVIPLVGEEISAITDPFFESLDNARQGVTDGLLAAISEATDANSGGVIDVYQDLLFDLFSSTMGILNDRADDGDNIIDEDDIVITVGNPEYPEAGPDHEFVQFDMHLGQTYELVLPFDGLSMKLGDLDLDDIMPDFGFSIDAPDGIHIDFEWAFRFGFGISALEGFYFNGAAREFSHDIYFQDWHYDPATDALTFTNDSTYNPNALDVEELFFSLEITTPGLNSEVALGLIQGEITDGTQQATSITLPGTSGGEYFEIDDPLISFDSQDFDFEITTYDQDYTVIKSTHLTYDHDSDMSDIDNLLELIEQLNIDLLDEQITVVPNLDNFMEPTLVFRSRDANVMHMVLKDYEMNLGMNNTPYMAENLAYQVMVEDQRTFGLGFTGDETKVGSGLTAEFNAPWGGQLAAAGTMSKTFEVGGNLSAFSYNTALTLTVGGTDILIGDYMNRPLLG